MSEPDPTRLLARLRRGLAPLVDAALPEEPWERSVWAAVAALLRFDRGGPEVLLIERARHPRDRWSGQVALPGGRASTEDSDLVETAVREAREEVGRDLRASARALGALPPRPVVARGRPQAMHVTPFVFEQLCDEPLDLGPEARDAFWLRLDRAAAGEYAGTHRYLRDGRTFELPSWNVGARVVWGMTHRMLGELARLAGLRGGADPDRSGPGPED